MQHIVFFIQKLFRGRRVTAILIVLCVLIVVGIWKALTSAVQSPRYQTTQATKGTLIVSTVASGQVSTANSASVTTTISGVVNKTYAKNGQVVKAGDTIATIDLDLTSKQKYTQALASYQSARNAVESAKAQQLSLQATMFGKWDTYKTLAESDLYKDENSANRNLPEFHIPQKEWLAAESQYKTQQHVVTQTQSSLSNAWQQLQQSSPTLVAPISGVVQGLSLQPGAVLASTTSDTTQKIATIQTLAFPTVSVNLSEIDIAKLQLGQKATVTVDALTDKTFTGKVISIDPVGTLSSGVAMYPVVIQLDTAVPELFVNMSAQASIVTHIQDSVVLVPTAAVQTQGQQKVVRIMKNGTPQMVIVETGQASDTQVAIISGVQEGDEVVTSVINTTQSSQRASGSQSPFSGLGFGGRTGGFGGGGTNVRISR